MNILPANTVTSKRLFLRTLLVAFVLLLALASSGCVSEKKHEEEVNAAYQRGQSQGKIEGAAAERKAAEAEIQKIREASKLELNQLRETSKLEMEKIQETARIENQQAYLAGYGHASSGLPLSSYAPLETPSRLVLVLFYLCVGILVATIGAASIYLIATAGGSSDKVARILPLVFSFYAWYRFIRPPGDSYLVPDFRVAIANSPLLEFVLLIMSFAVCHVSTRLLKSSSRRLWVDAVATFLAGIALLQLLEYGFNADLLVRLGSPTLALRLALAPIIGGIAYALLYVGKIVAQKSEPGVEHAHQAADKPPGGRLFRDA